MSGFNGNNNLPLIESGAPQLPGGIPFLLAASLPGNAAALQIPITRAYPAMWMVGGDAAVPSRRLSSR